jgi:threonine dehydratase
MDDLFTRITEAHAAIRPQVLVTPLDRSPKISAELGCEVWFKCDHHQPTGSFKLRGATNKIRVLGDAARKVGVTTSSTGNHGQATARAGALAGVAVTVYVSKTTTQAKMDAIRSWGAELVVVDMPPMDAELFARREADAHGKIYISPYNDLDVVAGQGTLGMEIAQQVPDLDAVFIALGCGGLLGGAGFALKKLSPRTKVIGVSPANSAAMIGALKAGKIIDVPETATLSDGTAGAVEPGSVTFPICQQVIDDTLTVSEAEIADAMRKIAISERWMVEGAAGVALAGLVKQAAAYKGRKVAVVLCGRNIQLDTFLKAVA